MSLQNSLEKFLQQTGILLMENLNTITDDVILARHKLERLNKKFLSTYEGIGIGTQDDKEYQYLPDFHKNWQAHHAEIVNARLDRPPADGGLRPPRLVATTRNFFPSVDEVFCSRLPLCSQ
jgi:hypothetical protein